MIFLRVGDRFGWTNARYTVPGTSYGSVGLRVPLTTIVVVFYQRAFLRATDLKHLFVFSELRKYAEKQRG